MPRKENEPCVCHNTKCKRHGDCAACQAFHKNRTIPTRCQQLIRKAANPKPTDKE